jgi:uncharacterized protein YggE
MFSLTEDKNKVILGSVAVVALTAIVIVSLVRDRIVNQNYNSINVVGRGTVQYVPDTAIITAGANYVSAASASVVQSRYTNLYERLTEKLTTIEDAEVEIYPASAMITPAIDSYNTEKPIGNLTGNYQVVIKVKNITAHTKSVERVLEMVTKEGLNQIFSVNYTMSNLDDVRTQAWTKAYESLEKNKQTMETNTDLALGDLVNFYETVVSTGDNMINSGYYGYPTQTLMPREYVIEVNAGYRVEESDEESD